MSIKYVDENGLAQIATIVNEKLSQKVDKVSGKQLSTNDYTTAEKTKLAGIETGANNYTLPTASATTLGGIKVGNNLSIDSNGVLSSTDTNTTYSVMSGATSSAAGTSGLVPAPASGKQASFLRGDGTWVVPTNTTYSVATQTANGLMSSTDKVKLDGVAEGATANTASTTTPLVAGTAAVGTDTGFARGDHVHPAQTTVSGNAGTATKLATARTIAISGGATGTATSFNGSANITIPVTSLDATKLTGTASIDTTGNAATATKATQDSAGQDIADTYIKGLSVSGKTITYTKGDGDTGTITTQDTNTTYTAGTGLSLSGTTFSVAESGVTAGSYGPTANVTGTNGTTINVPQITVDATGRVTSVTNRVLTNKDTNTTYSVATQSANGLMSAEDKTKLDGMTSGTTTHGYVTIASGTTLTNGYAVTLPISYIVGGHQLELYANGERLILKDDSTSDGHYQESGTSGASSTKITFYRTSADGSVTLTSDLVLYAVVKA